MDEQPPHGVLTVAGIDVEWLDAAAVESLFEHYFVHRWLGKRKAAPLNQLLTRSRSWAMALPEDVRPILLMRTYPRIVNHIAASWRDPSMLGPYLESLLVDGRGDRAGFAADILQELRALRSYALRGGFRYGRSDVDPGVVISGSASPARTFPSRNTVPPRAV